MRKRNVPMTSVEAASLLISNGMTTDPEQANLIQEGRNIDPEALEKAYYRRLMGFDFTMHIDEANRQFIARDDEQECQVKGTYLKDDDAGNAKRMAKACQKLKRMHDRMLQGTPD